nr:O-antigen ligase family protein [uncultured Celeribacter sp.]
MIDFARIVPRPIHQRDPIPAPEDLAETLHFTVHPVAHTPQEEVILRRLNRVFLWLIAAMLFLAPFPAGSHRPIAWMIWSANLALMAAVYFLLRAKGAQLSPLRSQRFAPLICVALLMPAFATLQMLPLGDLFAGSNTTTGLYRALFGTLIPEGRQPASLSLNAPATGLGILRLGGLLCLFILVLETCSAPIRTLRLMRLIYFGMCLQALWAMIALRLLGDIALFGEKTAYLGWATGGFVNRNSFATYLGMALILGSALMLRKLHRQSHNARSDELTQTGLHLASLLLLSTTLLATGSRMGIGATVVGLIVLFLCDAQTRPRRQRRWVLTLLAAGIILGGIALALSANTGERLLFLEQDLATRLALYAQVFDLIQSRPWTGYGLDCFSIAFPLRHTEPVSAATVWDMAHNSYLTLWAELGVIAGSAPLIALTWAAWRLIKQQRGAARFHAAPVAALAVMAQCAVHSTVDFSLEIEANTLLFVAIVALGLGRIFPTKGPIT